MKSVVRFLTAASLAMCILVYGSGSGLLVGTAAAFTKREVTIDLLRLEELLKQYHPNLYAHRSLEQLEARFQEIRDSLTFGETTSSAAFAIQSMLAAVCDEHTGLVWARPSTPGERRRQRVFETHLIATENGVLLDDENAVSDPRYLRRVGERDGAEIGRLIRNSISVDGCVAEDGRHFIATREMSGTSMFRIMHRLVSDVCCDRGIEVAYVRKSAPEREIIWNSVDRKSWHLFSNVQVRDVQARERSTLEAVLGENGFDPSVAKGLMLRRVVNGPSIAISRDRRTAYIRLSRIGYLPNYAQRTNATMRRLIKENPERLVLDLTHSPGGITQEASRILSYLLPVSHQLRDKVYRRTSRLPTAKEAVWALRVDQALVKKAARQFRRGKKRNGLLELKARRVSFGNPHYPGKIVVLVSPNTHSAATMISQILRNKVGATVVGFANGGSDRTSCKGATHHFILPETGFRVAIPQTCFSRPSRRIKAKEDRIKVDVVVPLDEYNGERMFPRILRAGFSQFR